MSSNGNVPPREGYMAGDDQELRAKKLWYSKEVKLLGNPIASQTFSSKKLLTRTMSENDLVPHPAYAPAASSLRGRSRQEWARYAGNPLYGSNPLIGYNEHWAAVRSKTPAPFAHYRTRSTQQIAMETGVAALDIKPVDRSKLPKLRKKPSQGVLPPPDASFRVPTLDDLAPEVVERRGRNADSGLSANDSTIAYEMGSY